MHACSEVKLVLEIRLHAGSATDAAQFELCTFGVFLCFCSNKSQKSTSVDVKFKLTDGMKRLLKAIIRSQRSNLRWPFCLRIKRNINLKAESNPSQSAAGVWSLVCLMITRFHASSGRASTSPRDAVRARMYSLVWAAP